MDCLPELLVVNLRDFLLMVELEFELLLELGHLTLMLSLLFESNSLELAFEFCFVLCDSFEFFFVRSDQWLLHLFILHQIFHVNLDDSPHRLLLILLLKSLCFYRIYH